MPLH
jgi:hypothetical protein